MRRLVEQHCFRILEVAADWHELMVPQHDMQHDRHTTTPISRTRPLPRSP